MRLELIHIGTRVLVHERGTRVDRAILLKQTMIGVAASHALVVSHRLLFPHHGHVADGAVAERVSHARCYLARLLLDDAQSRLVVLRKRLLEKSPL